MTAKEYHKKYFPNLLDHAAKMISAMESECKTSGKIFDKLAEIFSEYGYATQNECVAILNIAMIRIWRFKAKSLVKKNKEREQFKKDVERQFHKICSDARIDDVLTNHMHCALRAVWRNVELELTEQHKRIDFYESKLEKHSRRFT